MLLGKVTNSLGLKFSSISDSYYEDQIKLDTTTSVLFQTVNFQDTIMYETSKKFSTSLKVYVLGQSARSDSM